MKQEVKSDHPCFMGQQPGYRYLKSRVQTHDANTYVPKEIGDIIHDVYFVFCVFCMECVFYSTIFLPDLRPTLCRPSCTETEVIFSV